MRSHQRRSVFNKRNESGGFTFLELLVSVATITVLVALLLPAIAQAREVARKEKCKNNLKQLGLAMHNYHDVFITFPPGTTSSSKAKGEVNAINYPDTNFNGAGGLAWGISLAPFLDQATLHNRCDHTKPAWDVQNLEVATIEVAVFRCPDVPDALKVFEAQRYTAGDHQRPSQPEPFKQLDGSPIELPVASYLAMAGTHKYWTRTEATSFDFNDQKLLGKDNAKPVDGVFYRNSFVGVRQTTDGLATTILMVETNPAIRRQTWFGVIPGAAVCKNKEGEPTDACESAGSLVVVDSEGFAADYQFATGKKTAKKKGNQQAEVAGPTVHPGGAHALIGDGTVRFLASTIDPVLWRALCTRNGGEKVVGKF